MEDGEIEPVEVHVDGTIEDVDGAGFLSYGYLFTIYIFATLEIFCMSIRYCTTPSIMSLMI